MKLMCVVCRCRPEDGTDCASGKASSMAQGRKRYLKYYSVTKVPTKH